MLPYPQIDPVLLRIGPLALHWYGLMYVLGFAATFWLVRRQIRRHDIHELAPVFENLNMTLLISLVLGGRLGYVLFYNFSYYLHHPLQIANTLAGGMSFHGALIGVLLGGIWYCRRHHLHFLKMADIYVATIPVGLGLGRIGNFINGELYGRITEVPWAMVFPDGGPLPRHPSQLYEAALEGGLLFALLALMAHLKRKKGWGHGSILAFFLVYYGVIRSFVELFREPDGHIGLMAGLLSRGQLLSLAMAGGGFLLLRATLNRPQTA
jgi:phosphatidylglycerol:prolipoprotein diacylglycerol transferase